MVSRACAATHKNQKRRFLVPAVEIRDAGDDSDRYSISRCAAKHFE